MHKNAVIVLIALLFLSSGLLVMRVHGQSSNSSGAVAFTLIVGRTGFNGSSSAITLKVNQGDTVTITFLYGDGDLQQDNPHVIELEGYNKVTSDISKKTPIQTVQFTAGQVGTFLIHCVVPCTGNENLQNGWLEVKSSGLPGIPTVLSIEDVQFQNGSLYIVSSLENESGYPVVGVLVDFLVTTKVGMMNIGGNITDANGIAQMAYLLPSYRQMTVGVFFTGSGHYASSNATQVFTPPSVPAGTVETTPFVNEQNKLIDLRLVGVPTQQAIIMVALVLIVIGSVWLTYAGILRLILKIRKASKLGSGGGN